ncbi:MAG: Hsp20/alpha crystallin family protein [Chromatiales bacterium]|nr:Hsp20/alpha crystallin family protein [Chromatiales bacterium]
MTYLATNNRWSLFDDMDRQIRRFLQTSNGHQVKVESWIPAADIVETEEKYILLTDIPGVDPASIEVSMDDNVLVIAGKREAMASEEGVEIHRRERISGDFERRFRLPETVAVSEISATGKHGVLEVVIPKKPVEQPRRIPVTH